MGFLDNKKILIVGVANKFSIAAGIAEAMHNQGAEIILSYQSERLRNKVVQLGETWNCKTYIECDVTSDESISSMMDIIKKEWGCLDGIIHAVGFAPANELDGNFVDVATREGFLIAHDISVYSFTALAKAGKKLMTGRNASMLTLSYLGAERTLPNYNVMGVAKAALESTTRYLANSMGQDNIRVNAISAGPVKTLAASGIKSFRKMLSYNADRSPLKRNITSKEVGNAAAFLCSDLASGITGEILYVDAGFNITAMGDLSQND
ncbi:enoyl-ACP reductase [SAR86 cluster bacterium]|jgi:enoyl-[acyl-carrier protein] reductase I|nr:enoyl-ACP reductase [SAR86 cluster bacterium]